MEIDNKFDIEQIVYLKTDIEQLPRIVRSMQVHKHRIAYQLYAGTNESWHEDFEITAEPSIVNTKDAKIHGFQKNGV